MEAIETARDSSYRKHLLYRQYSNGELTLRQAAASIAEISPPPRPVSRVRWLCGIVVAMLGAILLPSWATPRD